MKFLSYASRLEICKQWKSVFIITCVLISLSIISNAQRQRREVESVFSIALSPDGKTLAISRGLGEYERRFGQVEICDVETGKILRTIKGFDGPVWSMVFSPDGKTLISSSSEFLVTKIQAGPRKGTLSSALKWWDVQTGELKLKKAIEHENRMALMVSHSPAGNLLASVEYYTERSVSGGFSYVEDIKLLDAKTGEVKRKIKSGLRSDWSGVFAMEGRIISQRFPTQSGAMLYKGSTFSSDGQLLAVKSPANQVKVWNTQTGKELYTLKDFNGSIESLTFSPDTTTLAVSNTIFDKEIRGRKFSLFQKGEIRLYDVKTGKIKNTLTGHNGVSSISFTADNNVLLLSGYERDRKSSFSVLKLLNVQNGNFVTIRTDSENPIRSLAFSANKQLLGIRTTSPVVSVVDTQEWKVKSAFDKENVEDTRQKSTSRYVLSVSHFLSTVFSPDGKNLIGGNEKNEIKIWDPQTGEVKRTLKGHEQAVSTLAISSDGNTLVSGSLDETVRLWDLQTGTQKAVITPEMGEIFSVALSSDGQTLAIGSGSVITLWDAPTNKLKQTLSGHKANVNNIVFSVDNRLLASASDDGTIKIWDAENAEVKKNLTAEGKLRAVAFSPNSQTLASANDSGTVSLWDVQTGVLKQSLKKHKDSVNALAFSKDGHLLASGSDDRTVILWDALSGKSKDTLKGHDLTVTSIAFSPDGNYIASGSGNDSVILWDVKNAEIDRILK